MKLIAIKTAKIMPENDLVEVFFKSLKKAKYELRDGDIIAIVSKVVSLTEGRLVVLESTRANQIQLQICSREHISASKRSEFSTFCTTERYGKYKPNPVLEALIRKEADRLYPGEMYLTIKDGIFIPSAGIDTSNVPEGSAILWPKDAYKSAREIRTKILARYATDHAKKQSKSLNFFNKNCSRNCQIKRLGLLIFDSHVLPLRRGVTGIALGYAGFEGVEDCRGQKDIKGKKLRTTFRNIADNLASAATLLTGEANEKTPFVIIRGDIQGGIQSAGKSADDLTHQARIKFTDKKIRRSEIQIPPDECLYNSLYSRTSGSMSVN